MASTINAKNTSTGVVITPDASGQLELQTADTTRMTITSGGNVGIGTNSPISKLTVGGNPPNPAAISAVGSSGGLSLSLSDNINSSLYVRNATGGVIIGTDGGNALRFATSGNTSSEERLRIDNSGNVQLFTANTSILNSSGRKILNQTGSILQVVNATTATEVTSSSGTYVDTGLTATITPTSTSSKILVIVQQVGCGKLNDVTLQLKLLRNTTDLMWLERSGGWTAAAGRNFFGTCGCSFLDSPATTSAVTYKTQMAAFSPAAIVFTQFNVGAGNPTSTITLLEIAG